MAECGRLPESHRRNEIRLEADEFFRHRLPAAHRGSSPTPSVGQQHRWYYQRLQFRRMYRYGLSLLLVGALCNWIGFAQHYFAPVRYLGVGCVIAGALCICIALCRWLAIRSNEPAMNNHEIASCGGPPSIHVIAVPIQGVDGPFHSSGIHRQQQTPPTIVTKPPDYDTAVGSKPPSYDEAVRINPAVFLQLNTPSPFQADQSSAEVDPAAVQQPPHPQSSSTHRSPRNSDIDCQRCTSTAGDSGTGNGGSTAS